MKKKRTKKYAGRRTLLNPLTMFGSMGNQAHAEYSTELQAKTAAAMVAMMQGRGDKCSWDSLVGALNIAKVLCSMGIGADLLDKFVTASDVLLDVGVRSVDNGGKFTLRAPEIKALQDALEWHTGQLENIRAVDIHNAINEVERRLKDRDNNVSVNKELAARAAMRMAA